MKFNSKSVVNYSRCMGAVSPQEGAPAQYLLLGMHSGTEQRTHVNKCPQVVFLDVFVGSVCRPVVSS